MILSLYFRVIINTKLDNLVQISLFFKQTRFKLSKFFPFYNTKNTNANAFLNKAGENLNLAATLSFSATLDSDFNSVKFA